MKYQLEINQHNIKPHMDIEEDIQQQKNGLFNFSVIVGEGIIKSYVQYGTKTITEHGSIKTVIEEFSAAHNIGAGSDEFAVRPDNR